MDDVTNHAYRGRGSKIPKKCVRTLWITLRTMLWTYRDNMVSYIINFHSTVIIYVDSNATNTFTDLKINLYTVVPVYGWDWWKLIYFVVMIAWWLRQNFALNDLFLYLPNNRQCTLRRLLIFFEGFLWRFTDNGFVIYEPCYKCICASRKQHSFFIVPTQCYL